MTKRRLLKAAAVLLALSLVGSAWAETVPTEEPIFYWQTDLAAAEFILYIQIDDEEKPKLIGRTAEQRMIASPETCGDGINTLWIGAIMPDGTAIWSKLLFIIARKDGTSGGGGHGGGGGGGAPSGNGGLAVTPGKALTTSHASGTKDMQLYGTVVLQPSENASTELVMGGETLLLQLDGGESACTAGKSSR